MIVTLMIHFQSHTYLPPHQARQPVLPKVCGLCTAESWVGPGNEASPALPYCKQQEAAGTCFGAGDIVGDELPCLDGRTVVVSCTTCMSCSDGDVLQVKVLPTT